MDTTLVLSGNFGELRQNHFHYGLDITSGGKEGLKVYAADDGYLSRIKVSTTGYGKVIYITHASGYTTVYGHLQRFHGPIEKLIHDYQYKNEVYEVELFPGKDFIIKKGQLIGYLGNTGASTGPHLHFEVRQTSTEKIINPLYFGFPVSDTVAPSFALLRFYPQMPGGTINEKNAEKEVVLIRKKGKYVSEKTDTLVLSGFIGIGVDAYDRESQKKSQNGLYCLHMYLDNISIYSYCIDSFAFSDSRNVNAHVDYEWFMKKNRFIQRCYILPCNKMPIYSFMTGNGIIEFKTTGIHRLKFIACDFQGNETILNYTVKSVPYQGTPFKDTTDITCTKPFEIKSENVRLNFPADCFYEDQKFTYSMAKDTLKGALGPVHTIMSEKVPVNLPYEASFRIPDVPDSLKGKLLVVSVTSNGRFLREGGEVTGNWIKATLLGLGKFTVAIDTVPPDFFPRIDKNGNFSKGRKRLEILVNEQLSGINYYRGTIDGKWELFEYMPRQGILFFTPGDTFAEGKHHVILEIKDRKGNSKKKEFDFNWKKPPQ